jgi:hypothetical protein
MKIILIPPLLFPAFPMPKVPRGRAVGGGPTVRSTTACQTGGGRAVRSNPTKTPLGGWAQNRWDRWKTRLHPKWHPIPFIVHYFWPKNNEFRVNAKRLGHCYLDSFVSLFTMYEHTVHSDWLFLLLTLKMAPREHWLTTLDYTDKVVHVDQADMLHFKMADTLLHCSTLACNEQHCSSNAVYDIPFCSSVSLLLSNGLPSGTVV